MAKIIVKLFSDTLFAKKHDIFKVRSSFDRKEAKWSRFNGKLHQPH